MRGCVAASIPVGDGSVSGAESNSKAKGLRAWQGSQGVLICLPPRLHPVGIA